MVSSELPCFQKNLSLVSSPGPFLNAVVNDVAQWSPIPTAGVRDYMGVFQSSFVVSIPESFTSNGATVATAVAYDPDEVRVL